MIRVTHNCLLSLINSQCMVKLVDFLYMTSTVLYSHFEGFFKHEMKFLNSGFFKNKKYYRIKTYKIIPAEPSMNMLANQSVYGKNLRISYTFSRRFLWFCIYFDHFEGVFTDIMTLLSLNCPWLHLGQFKDQKDSSPYLNYFEGFWRRSWSFWAIYKWM